MNATPPLLPSRSSADRLPSATARLGWFPAWIVGRRYYQASPTPDAPLAFVREPDNPHDGDAVAVHATRDGKLAGKVGHLPREDAACLAPLLDRCAIRLSGMLAGADDPTNRSPIRLDVALDQEGETLAGPGGRTAEAIWHAQLFAVWQARDAYTHKALAAYRDTIRPVAHSGTLWPETQLFYRLLKGAVEDGKAAEAHERHLARLRAIEAADRRAAERCAVLRAVCACEPAGELLAFGGLRVLPLRVLRPAPLLPLSDALRQQVAVLHPMEKHVGRQHLRVLTAVEVPDLLAVQHERLDTTAGLLRVRRDQLLAAADGGAEFSLEVVWEDRHPLERPIFLRGSETPEPDLPELPSGATGFAVFVGAWLRQIVLFAHPGCAAVARHGLRRLAWHLPTPDDGLTAAGAAQRVARILADLKFDGLDADETPCLASQPGLEGGDIALRGDTLAYLRLRLNEPAFVAGRQPEIPAPGPAEVTAEPSDSSSDAAARTGIGITLFLSFVWSFFRPFLPA